VFESSFGSQNEVQCTSQHIKRPLTVKIKEKNVFSYITYVQTLAVLLSLAISIFLSPLPVLWLKLGVTLHPLCLTA
jgi:hypothetical protein